MLCPNCYSDETTELGRLGAFMWVRCRYCGWEYCIDDQEYDALVEQRDRAESQRLCDLDRLNEEES